MSTEGRVMRRVLEIENLAVPTAHNQVLAIQMKSGNGELFAVVLSKSDMVQLRELLSDCLEHMGARDVIPIRPEGR